MKGKLFNVRGEKDLKIAENKEICEIKQILGLELGMKYTKEVIDKKLRYSNFLLKKYDEDEIKQIKTQLYMQKGFTLSKRRLNLI